MGCPGPTGSALVVANATFFRPAFLHSSIIDITFFKATAGSARINIFVLSGRSLSSFSSSWIEIGLPCLCNPSGFTEISKLLCWRSSCFASSSCRAFRISSCFCISWRSRVISSDSWVPSARREHEMIRDAAIVLSIFIFIFLQNVKVLLRLTGGEASTVG